jgi:hypothetical protein
LGEDILAGKFENEKKTVWVILLGVFLFAAPVFPQSTSLDFPTPVSTDQIAGRIRARDIGDSRLTSHYYLFETGTGDVLLNIETSNLNGDVDIYTAGSLKPLLKASVYAVGYATVMQRQVYLRLPSRLILRIEGRTPNDDPGIYKIKFSGVFKPVAVSSVPRNPGDPRVSSSEASEGAVARVNSAGTIIEEIKPIPPPETPKAPKTTTTTAATKNTPRARVRTNASAPKPKPAETSKPKSPAPDNTTSKTKTIDKSKTPDKAADKAKEKAAGDTEASKRATGAKTSPGAKKSPVSKATTAGKAKEEPADPLAGVSLMIKMKDGDRLSYPMSDVVRVNVDKSVVTVVLKNGEIHRLSLLDISEMKIGH